MIKIIAVGKIKEKYLKDAIAEYEKRLQTYTKLEIIESKEEEVGEELSEKEIEIAKNKEGDEILKKISENSYIITLEINGKMLDSVGLSEKIDEVLSDGYYKDLVFIIGGSNGLSKSVIDRSDYALSFSKMTFPHQLMRVILIEQIYRSFRIINNHPYHK